MVKYLPVHVCLEESLHNPWFKCKTRLDLFFTKSLKDNDSFGEKKKKSHIRVNTIFYF